MFPATFSRRDIQQAVRLIVLHPNVLICTHISFTNSAKQLPSPPLRPSRVPRPPYPPCKHLYRTIRPLYADNFFGSVPALKSGELGAYATLYYV